MYLSVDTYVEDANGDPIPYAPTPGKLYTYTEGADGYVLGKVLTGADVGVGEAASVPGTYSSATNKLGTTRVATDATVFVKYETNKGTVLTGADVDGWKDANYTVTEAYVDGTVKAMVVDLAATKLPGATSDAAYAVILGDVVNGANNTKVATLWTADGIIEDAVVNGTGLVANTVYEYTMNGTEYDLTATTAAKTVVGAVTEIDGKYVTILVDGAAAGTEYVVTADTVKLFVDTKNDAGANDGSIIEATEFENGKFYGNVIVVIDDDTKTEGETELGCVVVDIQNKLLDSADNEVVVNKAAQ